MSTIAIGFLPQPIQVAVEKLLPSRIAPAGLASTVKFKQIRASILEVDLIEPLSVSAADRQTGTHLVLDGQVRLMILKDLGYTEAPCLIALDDESYTYNNRINRLSTLQEHFMIRRAIDRGLSAARLAKALDVDVTQILKKSRLLEGVCSEAAELLKDRQCSLEVFASLRRMKPLRQIECAELMISANATRIVYARALLAATSPDMLAGPPRAKPASGMAQDQVLRMEREMSNIHSQYRLAEKTYGEDTLNLVLASGYVSKLVDNKRVFRYLRQHHPLMLEQLMKIAQTNMPETELQ